MEEILWADRGQSLQLDRAEHAQQTRRIGVSRLGSAQASPHQLSIWVQLRGSSWIEAREGRFRLRRGDWIAFDRDSRPEIHADRHGLCLGLVQGPGLRGSADRPGGTALLTGQGRVGHRDARMLVRLWRRSNPRGSGDHGSDGVAALCPLLLHLASIQCELAARLLRCPGRSRQRKRQVFGRLQRARMYLEGNCDRVVRLSELAELTSFSSWYLSKTFQGLYGEGPKAASARIRLERAADLLIDSSLTVGEVAAACGFENCCSFARAFRTHHGMSASAYRQAGGVVAPIDSWPDSAKPVAFERNAA